MDDIEDIAEEIWVLAVSVVGEAISVWEVLHSWAGEVVFTERGCGGTYLGSLKELSSGSINDRLEEFSNSTSDFDISGEAAIKGYICH